MGIHIDDSELGVLQARIATAAPRVGARIAKAIRKTAHDIEADAKILVPVDTGNLKNSISTDILNDGRFENMAAEIGPTAHYGRYVEEGTSRMGPQPYLRPAFDRRLPGFERAIAEAGEDAI